MPKNLLFVFLFLAGSVANAKAIGPVADHPSTFSQIAMHSGYREADSVAYYRSKLLPMPQQVSLRQKQFRLHAGWTIDASHLPVERSSALISLQRGMDKYFSPAVYKGAGKNRSSPTKNVIRLFIKEGTVRIGKTIDKNAAACARQAYTLKLDKNGVVITGNSPEGLFYGVQTFLQLIQPGDGFLLLPEGEITDWPSMQLRTIFWDDSHHLERLPALKKAIDQAARYKINGFVFKLEGHFQFAGAPALVEPYALSPEEHQALTDYALSQYVQLIPYLDAPAHVAFILKHPEYTRLRAYPNSNYQLSITHPGTDTLIKMMFDELIAANKGGKYIFLSTDEAYYAGKSEGEKERAKELGGNGKLLADFITRIADYLHAKGRTVLIWGEAPLTPADVANLPKHLINAINQDSDVFGASFKDHGIKHLIFTSAQGVEPLFPEYYKLPQGQAGQGAAKSMLTDDEMQQSRDLRGRISDNLNIIQSSIRSGRSDLMGIIVCGWADAGLHPETFWLGYATGTAATWNTASVSPEQLADAFFNSYYGGQSENMEKIYRQLCYQTQFWANSWDWSHLNLRSPLFGYSAGLFDPPQPTEDQSLPMLPIPSSANLAIDSSWRASNSARIQRAEAFMEQNNELIGMLHLRMRLSDENRRRLQVLLSVAQLCRQNLRLLQGFSKIDSLLALSARIAPTDPASAIAFLDQALDHAAMIRDARNETFQEVVTTWYADWHPRVEEANGRRYLDRVDDVKDHLPVRTIDMSYLIYRELNHPFDTWAEGTVKSRNAFAQKYQLPLSAFSLDWKKYPH